MVNRITRVSVLGSTGSVGTQTLDIIRSFPDRFKVVGLAANKNYTLLEEQVLEFSPKFVSCDQENMPPMFLRNSDSVLTDMETVATVEETDVVVIATTGHIALKTVLRCISLKKKYSHR